MDNYFLYVFVFLIYVYSAKIVAERTTLELKNVLDKVKQGEITVDDELLKRSRKIYILGITTTFIPLVNTLLAFDIILERFEEQNKNHPW